MSIYHLRPATELDYAHIVFIQRNDGYKHSYYLSEDRIERLVKSGEKFFMLYKDDRFIGMASIDSEIRVQLHFFSVLEEFAGQGGAAKKMLELLLKEVKKQEVEHKIIHCFTELDSPLLGFLKSQGFEEVGFYKNRYQNGKSAVIVEKKI